MSKKEKQDDEKKETLARNMTVIKCEKCLKAWQGASCIGKYNTCGSDFTDMSAFSSSGN